MSWSQLVDDSIGCRLANYWLVHWSGANPGRINHQSEAEEVYVIMAEIIVGFSACIFLIFVGRSRAARAYFAYNIECLSHSFGSQPSGDARRSWLRLSLMSGPRTSEMRNLHVLISDHFWLSGTVSLLHSVWLTWDSAFLETQMQPRQIAWNEMARIPIVTCIPRA